VGAILRRPAAGIASLPRPGAWMVRVKQAFGVVILVTAAYYGYQSYSLFANRWVDAGEVANHLLGGEDPGFQVGQDKLDRDVGLPLNAIQH
jgi:hypothetical protein